MDERDQQRKIRHRLSVLRHVVEASRNVAATCRCYGISRPTFYKWLRQDEEFGEEGLRDRYLRRRVVFVVVIHSPQWQRYRVRTPTRVTPGRTIRQPSTRSEPPREQPRSRSRSMTVDGRAFTRPRSAADGAIVALLSIVHDAQLTGDRLRLKGCRQCQYAFYRPSRNRSAAWCSMSICGNRSKNRAYYRRNNPHD